MKSINKSQLMVDIETLATGPEAVVYEIGLVKFKFTLTPDGTERRKLVSTIQDEVLWKLHTKDQGRREIDPGTLKWMIGTPGRMAAYGNAVETGMSARAWCSELQGDAWFEGSPQVWCKGPHFDISILQSLFTQSTGKSWVPWKYSNVRDLRTLGSVCEFMGIEIASEDPPHDALEDCRLQVRQVTQMMSELWARTQQ